MAHPWHLGHGLEWIAGTIIGWIGDAAGAGDSGGYTSEGTRAQQDADALDLLLAEDDPDTEADEGGYYEEADEALQAALDDAAQDALDLAAELERAKEEYELAVGVSLKDEEAAAAGYTAQKAGLAVQGLETAGEGARARGSIAAAAGAGNLSGASPLRMAAEVSRVTSRRVAATNLDIRATQLSEEAMHLTAAFQRERYANDLERATTNSADALRAIGIREAELAAALIRNEYERTTTGLQQDRLYQTADWYGHDGGVGPGTVIKWATGILSLIPGLSGVSSGLGDLFGPAPATTVSWGGGGGPMRAPSLSAPAPSIATGGGDGWTDFTEY